VVSESNPQMILAFGGVQVLQMHNYMSSLHWNHDFAAAVKLLGN